MQERAGMTGAPVRWDSLLRAVRSGSPELYRRWFEELEPARIEGGELQVFVTDPARAHYLSESCTQAFVAAAMRVTGLLLSVRFICPHPPAPLASSEYADQATLTSMSLTADYTFEQFVVGTSNRLAHAACRAVCTQPGTLYNPLFIHGSTGLGKTHLLQATCQQFLNDNDARSVIYVSCETFINDFVRAIETGQLGPFRDTARRADALVIDDVQFLAGRESSQEELFHTFNVLYQSRRQIILSADSPPSEIPTLEDRLVSRFNWGLVTQIDPPNRETRQAILQKKARLRGCEISDDVLDLIAQRVESNIRTLEGALTRLITETQLGGKPMSRETALEMLESGDVHTGRPLHISEILETVSKHFGLRLSDLLGRKRSRSVSYPRQVGMYLARKLTPLSLEEIGGHFGGRDHSTVLHAERVIDSDRKHGRETAETLSFLTRQLLARR
jgi:chromosomal replication initiator protein